MEQNNVMRLLTLYKQHYRDEYEMELNKKYSTWGYYDCMEVEKVDSKFANKRILETEGNVNITDLWYKMAEEGMKLKGYYGRLHIGLFGFENDEAFWQQETMLLCVVFLQVESDEKNTFMEEIKLTCSNHENLLFKIYRTLDNMDYVCCMKGNQYSVIMNCIEKLRKMSEVAYVRSIIGIESQLIQNEEKLCELEKESIKEIRIQMATRDPISVQKWWNANCGHIKGKIEITETQVLGHHNIEICLQDVTMRAAAELMKEKSGVTHTSKLYGNKIYNINTVIIPDKKFYFIQSKNQEEPEDNNKDPHANLCINWCEDQINRLRGYLKNAGNCNDEALYSYYLAIIRSLNMLAQYENFSLSKELFYMVAPAFEMFLKQLEKEGIDFGAGINNVEKTMYGVKLKLLENIKDTISNFLETVNEIIYHAVHTDQMFLAIPGYNGVAYDVPLKLCLLYLAYARQIGKIISDDVGNDYRCYIIPVVNAKPITTLARFAGSPNQRLIAIQTSQRSLYMPRAFCIIITHELAHYIGTISRQRQKRLSEFVYIYAYILAELIFESRPLKGKVDSKLLSVVKEQNKEHVLQYIINYLIDKIGEALMDLREKYDEKEIYHFSVLEPKLREICLELLCDVDGELNRLICGVDSVIMENMTEGSQELWDNLRRMHNCWIRNIKYMAVNGSTEEIMVSVIKEFREIYSDIVAVEILELGKEWRYYLETFSVSEGVKLKQELLSEELILRIALVVKVVNDQDVEYQRNWEALVSDNGNGFIETLAKIVDQWIKQREQTFIDGQMEKNDKVSDYHDWSVMYNLDATWKHMLEYAEAVRKSVSNQIAESQSYNESVQQVRRLFEFFRKYEKDKDRSYKDLFEVYDQMVGSYCREVEEIFKKD